jgi:hypothetical protein
MKRVRLGVGIALVVLVGAGAIVYASVPHTFNTGDTLQATDLNGNFSALDQRITALEAAQMHWDGYLSQGGGLTPAAPSGTMAHVTFTPPATGNIIVRVHFSTAVRNSFDGTPADCQIVSQLSTGTAAPAFPAVTGTLGISELYIAGNLPTELGPGTFQWFPQTAEAAFVATAGTPLTVYLNGHMTATCEGAVYYSLSFNADFGTNKSAVTVTAN